MAHEGAHLEVIVVVEVLGSKWGTLENLGGYPGGALLRERSRCYSRNVCFSSVRFHDVNAVGRILQIRELENESPRKLHLPNVVIL